MRSSDLWTRAAALSSSTVHEAAGRIGALPAVIKPLDRVMRVCGPALPVKSPPGDNLWLHRAIYESAPGEVLIVDTGEGVEFGYWGEVMAVAAQVHHIGGLVITGGVRDSLRIVELGFPVFSGAIAIRGAGKDPAGSGSIGEPVQIGGVTVNRGDLVLGDADGVVVVPSAQMAAAIASSEARDAEELTIFQELRRGQSSIAIYGLPGGEAWRS